MTKNQRRKSLLSLLALCIVAGLGVWSAHLFSPLLFPEGAPQFSDTDWGDQSTREFRQETQDRRIESVGNVQEQVSDDVSAGQSSGKLEGSSTRREDDAEAPRTLIVSFESVEGEPVAGMEVRCIVFVPLDARRRTHVVTKTDVTSEQGELEFVFPVTHQVGLEVVSKGWYLRPGTVVPVSVGRCTLTLAPTKTLKLLAQFDDGAPVSCRVTLFRQETNDVWSTKLRDGAAEIEGVAIDADVQCIISSQYRFPYKQHVCTFRQSELASGNDLLVVVPIPDEPNGKIRLEVTNGSLTRGQKVVLELEGGIAGSVVGAVDAQATFWESKPLTAGGRARLTIIGDEAWRSNWFEVKPGSVTIVKAELGQSASVVAKIVDANGAPLTNSLLRLKDSGYARYDSEGVPSIFMQSIARADENGMVVLSGMPAGEVAIEAEAWQREPRAYVIHLVAGETQDLGTIVLEDAHGEIFVELVGCEEGKQYSVMLTPPSGSEVFPMRRVEGKKLTISGLPMREYWVGVTFSSGGRLVWAEVDLSNQASQTVYLDVSDVTD